ncbi:MAG: D-alanyl-D-alanine carboxypeptidase/D-alanyl-D-alanine endopeptidase [Planctomycetaceae bacterium]
MAAWLVGLLLLAPSLETDIERILASSRSARGAGIAVGRVGEVPFASRNLDAARIPASNQKVLTAAAALAKLGPDFKFKTTVARGAGGSLVVVGSGDPNLSGRWFGGDPKLVLRNLARDLVAKGVRRVEGGVLLDASRFDDTWVHPEWPADQLGRWYSAPVAALVYNDSCWDVTVLPGPAPGTPARIVVEPTFLAPDLLQRCSTVTGRGEHLIHIGWGRGVDLEVRGGILEGSAGITESIPVKDPVAFFGYAFLAALRAEGIEVVGETRRGMLPGAEPLVVYTSGLDRTLQVMLTRSQNLYAECVFKALGNGSFESAGVALREQLERLEIPVAGLVAADGSGLARSNRVSAGTLYRVLQAMAGAPAFVEALASGGEGTLGRRYRELGTRVRLKTGTLRGVSTLSGYVTGREGGRYLFVVLINGDLGDARALQDRIVARLAQEP